MLINGERVRQARELKSLTQTALAKSVGVSQAAIAQIEAGAFLASDELVLAISRRTVQPLRFFQQEAPPEFVPGSLLFRAHAALTKREMTATYRHAQIAYELYMKLRARLRAIPVKFPDLSSTDPQRAARLVRKGLELSKDEPIPHLLNVLEWHGLVAVVIPAVKSREAFSYWSENTPILALSSNRSGDRGRMTISHEIGHLVLHRGKSRFEVNDIEADEFAAEFLMPESVMKSEIRSPVTLASLALLKPRWGVSIQALIRRAKDIDIITDRQYRYLFEQVSAMGWRMSEPVHINPEKPRALRQMAEMLYGDPIDYQTLAHDSALTLEFVRAALDDYQEKSTGSSAGIASNVVSLSRRSRRN